MSNEMRKLIDKVRYFGKFTLNEGLKKLKHLNYEFKCDDADMDGCFYHTPFGEIDTTEFAQFIDEMENYQITQEEFEKKFESNNKIENIIKNAEPEYLEFYDGSLNDKSKFYNFVVVFDGDIHYIFSV